MIPQIIFFVNFLDKKQNNMIKYYKNRGKYEEINQYISSIFNVYKYKR